MYDLSKIRVLAKQQKVKLKVLAKSIGLGEHGIHSMIRANSTKESTLKDIAKFFNVPVEYFNVDYNNNVNKVSNVSKAGITNKPKVIIQIELSEEDGNNVLKFVLGKDFTNLLNNKG